MAPRQSSLADTPRRQIVPLTHALQVSVLGKPFTKEDLLAAVAGAGEHIQACARHDTGDDWRTHVPASLLQTSGQDSYQLSVPA